MSNKPCAFCFVYCVLLDPCILSFRTGGDQKCPQSAWIAPILSCVRAQRWQNTRPEPLASICGWPGFRMPYLAWLRPCLTHGFWLVSVYSTFLAIKAPEHVCRLLIVSGLFNSPRFIITHNHKTSWGVKKNTANPINHLTCWHNPPVVGTWKSQPFTFRGWLDLDRGLHDFCALPAVADLCGILFRGAAPWRARAGETLKRRWLWWEYQGVLDTQKRDHRYIIHMYRSICYMYACLYMIQYLRMCI